MSDYARARAKPIAPPTATLAEAKLQLRVNGLESDIARLKPHAEEAAAKIYGDRIERQQAEIDALKAKVETQQLEVSRLTQSNADLGLKCQQLHESAVGARDAEQSQALKVKRLENDLRVLRGESGRLRALESRHAQAIRALSLRLGEAEAYRFEREEVDAAHLGETEHDLDLKLGGERWAPAGSAE